MAEADQSLVSTYFNNHYNPSNTEVVAMTAIKNVQIELPQELYNEFRAIVEAEGKTIKTAVVEAINEWKMHHSTFDTTDPLFDFSNVIEAGGNAARVDEITYSREAID